MHISQREKYSGLGRAKLLKGFILQPVPQDRTGRIPPVHLKKILEETGFTIIEFLLAFGIFAVIAVSLYATFFNGVRLDKKAQVLESFFHDIRCSLDAVALDVENMLPYRFGAVVTSGVKIRYGEVKDLAWGKDASQDNEEERAFSGDDKSFSLLLSTDTGIKRVRYYLATPQEVSVHTEGVARGTVRGLSWGDKNDSEEKISLFVREELPFGEPKTDDPENGSDVEVLSKKVLEHGLKITYATLEEDKLVWKDEWRENFFPLGIRLTLTMVDPEDASSSVVVEKNILVPMGIWGQKEF